MDVKLTESACQAGLHSPFPRPKNLSMPEWVSLAVSSLPAHPTMILAPKCLHRQIARHFAGPIRVRRSGAGRARGDAKTVISLRLSPDIVDLLKNRVKSRKSTMPAEVERALIETENK